VLFKKPKLYGSDHSVANPLLDLEVGIMSMQFKN